MQRMAHKNTTTLLLVIATYTEHIITSPYMSASVFSVILVVRLPVELPLHLDHFLPHHGTSSQTTGEN